MGFGGRAGPTLDDRAHDGLNTSSHWFYEGDNDWVVGVRSCLTVPIVNYPGGVLLSAVKARHTEYFRNAEVTAHVLTWLAALKTRRNR